MLSKEQLEQFDVQGFVLVRGLFSSVMVRDLLAAIQELQASEAPASDSMKWWSRFHPTETRPVQSHFWDCRNVIAKGKLFLELVGREEIVLPICQILGAGISLHSSHAVVKGRSKEQSVTVQRLGWHRDLGVSSLEMSEPHPRLSVKAAVWLTEINGLGQGAMHVIPGSQRFIGPPPIDEANGHPYGATPVFAKPGDVLFFEQRLWHAASPNEGDRPRICLFYGYGYRWLRPQDFISVPEAELARQTPIMRQLLGGSVTQMGYHLPTPEDVPLTAWLSERKANGNAKTGDIRG